MQNERNQAESRQQDTRTRRTHEADVSVIRRYYQGTEATADFTNVSTHSRWRVWGKRSKGWAAVRV